MFDDCIYLTTNIVSRQLGISIPPISNNSTIPCLARYMPANMFHDCFIEYNIHIMYSHICSPLALVEHLTYEQNLLIKKSIEYCLIFGIAHELKHHQQYICGDLKLFWDNNIHEYIINWKGEKHINNQALDSPWELEANNYAISVLSELNTHTPLAHRNRASDYESEGRGFNSFMEFQDLGSVG
jgi:hypothetical protein